LNALGLMDRADPLNELVAKKIIEIAKNRNRQNRTTQFWPIT